MRKSKSENHKITFGKRRCGRARKRRGPKDKHIKPSVGQGK